MVLTIKSLIKITFGINRINTLRLSDNKKTLIRLHIDLIVSDVK